MKFLRCGVTRCSAPTSALVVRINGTGGGVRANLGMVLKAAQAVVAGYRKVLVNTWSTLGGSLLS